MSAAMHTMSTSESQETRFEFAGQDTFARQLDVQTISHEHCGGRALEKDSPGLLGFVIAKKLADWAPCSLA